MQPKRPTQELSEEIGFSFPVSNIRSRLIRGKFAEKVDAGAPVFLAAVLELVAAKVLNGARRNCIQESPGGSAAERIVPRHIQQAVKTSKELRGLWKSFSKDKPHSANLLKGCVLTIEGNFGVGKKLFLREFANAIRNQHDGVPVEVTDASPDHAFLQAWRGDCARFALPLYTHCATVAFTRLEHTRRSVIEQKSCGLGRLGLIGVLAGRQVGR